MGKMSFSATEDSSFGASVQMLMGPEMRRLKQERGNDRQKLKRFLRTLVFERAVCKVAIILFESLSWKAEEVGRDISDNLL